MKKRMNLKQIAVMVLIMLLFVCLYFTVSGPVEVYPAPADVFSLSKSRAAAGGEAWEFRVPEKPGREAYFVSDGKVYEEPYLAGVVFYDSTGGVGIDSEYISQYMQGDKHFYLGEKRWYLHRVWNEYTVAKAYFKISWMEGEEDRSEFLSSGDLTEEEQQEANEWIEKKEQPPEQGAQNPVRL